MNRIRKILFSLILVSTLILSVSACGNQKADTEPEETKQAVDSNKDNKDASNSGNASDNENASNNGNASDNESASNNGNASDNESTSDNQKEPDSQTVQDNQAEGFISEDVLVENEGRKIPATFVLPEGEEKFPLVVMHHGFAGNRQEGGGFKKIAEELAAQGIASIRLDFPGCGESEVPYTEYNFSNNMSDSKACLNYALESGKIDEERLGIFGYSMGGRISILLTQEENPYKAIALLAPAAFTSEDEQKAATEESLKQAEETGSVMIEWFDSELEVGRQYYQELLDSFAVIDTMEAKMPALLMYGDKDVMVVPEIARACAENLNAELIEITGADHGYGFYSGQDEYTGKVVAATAKFFKEQL